MYRKPIVSNALRVARWREGSAGGCVHFAFFSETQLCFSPALWPRATIPKDNMAEEILATVSTYYVTYVPPEAKTVMSAMSSDDWVALATCVLPLLCLIGAFIVQLFRCCGLCMPDGFDPTPAATLKDKYAKIEANKKPSPATKAAAKVAPAPAPAPKKASPPPAAAAKPTPAPKSGKGKLSA